MSYADAARAALRTATTAHARLSTYVEALAAIEHAHHTVRRHMRAPLATARLDATAALRSAANTASYLVNIQRQAGAAQLGGVLAAAPDELLNVASLCEEGLLQGEALKAGRDVVAGLCGRYAKLVRALAETAPRAEAA